MNRLYIPGFVNKHIEVMNKTSLDDVYKAVKLIKKATNEGHRIYTIGNGGSALIASHLATDLLHNANADARCLSDNIGTVTAIGNDNGFEQIFSRQLGIVEKYSTTDALLVAFSCSGTSVNVLKAVEKAYDFALDIVLITGVCLNNDLADVHIKIPSANVFVIEGVFSVLSHSIISYLRKNDYDTPS